MLEFNLEFKSKEIKVGEEILTLKEATGEAAVKFQNYLISQTKPDAITGKPTQLGDVASTTSFLVHLCLWRGDQRVPEKEIKNWPSTVVQKIFEEAQLICGMGSEDEEKVKKSAKGTKSGSK